MKTNLKKYLKLLFMGVIGFLGITPAGYAQGVSHTINSSGGTVAISNTIHEWSIAEMTLIATLTSPEVVLTQGLLQPFQTTLSINNPSGPKSKLSVYPNPAEETINFSITNIRDAIVDYKLVSITGQTILQGESIGQSDTLNQSIDISRLSSGTYLLRVFIRQGNAHHTQTVKVIKK